MRETTILVLYCGGTLGMVRHPSQGYVPYPGFLTETLRSQSRFHDPNRNSLFSWSDTTERYKTWTETFSRPVSPTGSKQGTQSLHVSGHASPLPHLQDFGPPLRILSSSPSGTFTRNAVRHEVNEAGQLELMLPSMILPASTEGKGSRQTKFAVLEYDPLLDSSNMETKDWLRLAADIDLNYRSFDAFVVLHGTDTMAYTSSALSMLLENLGKPVIVTGAQVPLSELRNDAIENVLGALILASSHPIPEVTLFFASTLYRGNRVSKLSNSSLNAFDSPNFGPLATAGITIEVNEALVRRPTDLLPFRAHTHLSQQVALLRLFPGLQVETIATFFKAPVRGVILHSFGAGNAPTRPDLLKVFEDASKAGIVIVNISQCIRGEVSSIYEVGKKLERIGVVAGGDMTPECALTKLEYLLGKEDLDVAQVRSLMGRSLRGELTERRPVDEGKTSGGNVLSLLQKVILEQDNEHPVSSDDNLDSLALDAERALLPYLVQQAVQRGDVEALDNHLRRDEILLQNKRLMSAKSAATLPVTALHTAAAQGSDAIVRRLLEAGLSVHQRDPNLNHTPLFVAACNGHTSTVTLLRSAGAHLSTDEMELGKQHYLVRSRSHRAEWDAVRCWAEAGILQE